MKIRRWRSIQVRWIIGLKQEFYPRKDWPYQQDWIVDTLSLDTESKRFSVSGHLNDKEFSWFLDCNRPLSWRYNLTNARYFIGSHEKVAR